MYREPDLLILGGTPREEAAIQWTDDDFGFDVDSVDPDSLNKTWTVDPGTYFDIIPGDIDDPHQLRVREDSVGVAGDLDVGGDFNDVTIDGTDPIRIRAFDTLSIRRSENDSDEIAEIVRHTSADYDVFLYQGGSRERVHTTADGDIDAATLDGRGPDDYAATGDDETITGLYDFETQPSIQNEAVATEPWAEGEFAPTTHDNDNHSETYATETFVTDALVDIANDGAEVDTDVARIDFTTDLGVTDTADGVEVEFVGATIPSDVYADGNLVVGDANGINFVDDFTISEGVDGQADVVLDAPDNLASLSADENVTGDWNFDGVLTLGGSIVATEGYADDAGFSGSYSDLTGVPSTFDPADHGDGVHTANYAHVDASETITSPWTFDANTAFGSSYVTYDGSWRHRYSSALSAFVFEQDGTAVAQLNDDGSFDVPSGDMTAAGDAVATEIHVENNYATDNHGNEDHSAAFLATADGTEREVWISSDGSVPDGADAGDIVLTEV